MKRLGRLAGALSLAILAACETTGNPRDGGLFGWSESKARERQAQKRAGIASAEAELTQENQRGEALQSRGASAQRHLAAAENRRHRTEERLRVQEARLVAKTEQLEAASPTPATASRARSYRREVITTAKNPSLTPQQRAERLHQMEAQIDAEQARLER